MTTIWIDLPAGQMVIHVAAATCGPALQLQEECKLGVRRCPFVLVYHFPSFSSLHQLSMAVWAVLAPYFAYPSQLSQETSTSAETFAQRKKSAFSEAKAEDLLRDVMR